MKTASKKAKGKATVKDLRVGKRSGTGVKGGRIMNVRANASSRPPPPPTLSIPPPARASGRLEADAAARAS